jgi:hypothetical protein
MKVEGSRTSTRAGCRSAHSGPRKKINEKPRTRAGNEIKIYEVGWGGRGYKGRVVVMFWGVTWNVGLACRRRARVELCQQDQSSRIVRAASSTEDQIEDSESGMPGSRVSMRESRQEDKSSRISKRGWTSTHSQRTVTSARRKLQNDG